MTLETLKQAPFSPNLNKPVFSGPMGKGSNHEPLRPRLPSCMLLPIWLYYMETSANNNRRSSHLTVKITTSSELAPSCGFLSFNLPFFSTSNPCKLLPLA